MKIKGIYQIKNIKNNIKYIGQSKDIIYRWREHLTSLQTNKHKNQYLQNSWNKNGIENFIFSILEICEVDKLNEKEQYHLNYNKDKLYNLSKQVGSGGYEVLQKNTLLIDLNGEIVKEFESANKIAKFLNKTGVTYRNINTQSIHRSNIDSNKYRIVTPEFFKNNKESIKKWTKSSVEKRINVTEYQIFKKKDTNFKLITYYNLSDIANYLKISKERVRQIAEINGLHKKTGISIFKLNLSLTKEEIKKIPNFKSKTRRNKL